MADTRIVYPLTNYLGAKQGEAVQAFFAALELLRQSSRMNGAVESTAECAAVMDMTENNVNAMRSITGGCIASMAGWEAAMSRMEVGV